MANPDRGEVDLVAGNKTYTLRLSLHAVAQVCKYLDIGINSLRTMLSDPDFRPDYWEVVMWGALREFHPCSIEEASDIMVAAGLPSTVEKLGETMRLNFPDVEEGSEPKNPR